MSQAAPSGDLAVDAATQIASEGGSMDDDSPFLTAADAPPTGGNDFNPLEQMMNDQGQFTGDLADDVPAPQSPQEPATPEPQLPQEPEATPQEPDLTGTLPQAPASDAPAEAPDVLEWARQNRPQDTTILDKYKTSADFVDASLSAQRALGAKSDMERIGEEYGRFGQMAAQNPQATVEWYRKNGMLPPAEPAPAATPASGPVPDGDKVMNFLQYVGKPADQIPESVQKEMQEYIVEQRIQQSKPVQAMQQELNQLRQQTAQQPAPQQQVSPAQIQQQIATQSAVQRYHDTAEAFLAKHSNELFIGGQEANGLTAMGQQFQKAVNEQNVFDPNGRPMYSMDERINRATEIVRRQYPQAGARPNAGVAAHTPNAMPIDPVAAGQPMIQQMENGEFEDLASAIHRHMGWNNDTT